MTEKTVRATSVLEGLDDVEGYDPLAELFDDEEGAGGDEEEGGGSSGLPTPMPTCAPRKDEREPAVRIAELFEQMRDQRHELMGILAACRTPQPNGDIEALVARLQEENRSVFHADSLCMLLERAGALEHVVEDGTPYDEVEVEPQLVVEDGVEYIQAAEPPADFWRSTEAGLAHVDADAPDERLRALLDEEPQFLHVYRQILEMLAGAGEGGLATKEIADVIDEDPALRVSPVKRLYTTYFVERLERCDAVGFHGAWELAPVGERYLASL